MDSSYQHSVKQWWLYLTAGIIFIFIAAVVLFYPATTTESLTFLFIASFGVVGLLEIFYAFNNRKQLQSWGWTLMSGLIDLTITFLLLTTPEIRFIGISLYIGFVMLFRSIFGIGFSTYMQHYKVRNWGIVLVLSIIGIVFSVLMIWETRLGVLNITNNTTIALLSVGFAQIGMAYELRRHENLFDHQFGNIEPE